MLSTIYRARRYSLHGYCRTWYEPCQVIRQSTKFVTVESKDYPDTPLYPGGTFRLNRSALEEGLKVYHSRHGEWFYPEIQSDAFLFPSKDVMGSADFAMVEAIQVGWDGGLLEWPEWQRNCWLYATLLRRPLRAIINQWEADGDSAFRSMAAEYRSRERAKLAEWT